MGSSVSLHAEEGWSLEVDELFKDHPIFWMPHAGTPESAAKAMVEALRKDGNITAYGRVDYDSKIIYILTAEIAPSGPLAKYIPKEANADDLAKRMPLIRHAARAEGGRPSIQVGKVEKGLLPIEANVSKTKNIRGGMLSSYGSRNSGENIASAFWQGGGHGFSGSLSGSVGLPFLTPDYAEGGRYVGLNGSIERPYTWGLIEAGASVSDYKQGGDVKSLDLNGRSGKLWFGYAYPFQGVKLHSSLIFGYQASDIGIAAIDGSQSNIALQLRADGARALSEDGKTRLSYDVQAVQGLWLRERGLSIGRDVDKNWSVLTADLTLSREISGWSVVGSGGLHLRSKTQPNQYDFYLGGPNRGSGYHTGASSAAEGFYYGMRLYTRSYKANDKPTVFRPFVGFNGANGEQHVGTRTLRAQSVEIGTQLQYGMNTTGEIGYAKITDNQGPHERSGRFIFNIVSRF